MTRGPVLPADGLVEEDGERAYVHAFLGDDHLVVGFGDVDAVAAQGPARARGDAADHNPDFAVAGGPEVGDAVLDVTPDAAVQGGGLRGDVGHPEGTLLRVLAVARDDGVVGNHVPAVVSALLVGIGSGGGGDELVLGEARAFGIFVPGVADDVVGAPDGMPQGVGPADQEFAAVEDLDVRRGGRADAHGCTREGDRTGRCLGIVFGDGVVTGPVQGVRDVRNRIAEPEEDLGEWGGPFGDPRARMVHEPVACRAQDREQTEEDRAEFQRETAGLAPFAFGFGFLLAHVLLSKLVNCLTVGLKHLKTAVCKFNRFCS